MRFLLLTLITICTATPASTSPRGGIDSGETIINLIENGDFYWPDLSDPSDKNITACDVSQNKDIACRISRIPGWDVDTAEPNQEDLLGIQMLKGDNCLETGIQCVDLAGNYILPVKVITHEGRIVDVKRLDTRIKISQSVKLEPNSSYLLSYKIAVVNSSPPNFASLVRLRVSFNGLDITPDIEYSPDQLPTSITQHIPWPIANDGAKANISFEELGSEFMASNLISDINLVKIADRSVFPLNKMKAYVAKPGHTLRALARPHGPKIEPVGFSYKISVVHEGDEYYYDYNKQIIEGEYDLDKNLAIRTGGGSHKWVFEHGTIHSSYINGVSSIDKEKVYEIEIALDDYLQNVNEGAVTIEQLCFLYDYPSNDQHKVQTCSIAEKINSTSIEDSSYN
ncbi:MAG: hypothetical protein KZQ66_13275 [Candidatus Thiodiazotropha sp. (ex Lucinoma aequizonata)]|nr:hypothetical protein [Candidatus Thiodiazotropha sp. (ex Lucinoma aequizonata)]MCU7886862.1 hypothetical protein [Candidatus Thiodiazotropha sp. (ex Lucinoma aequizonata)]MCU7895605.1 hypothetical protein [Candidatus Thiodiazotropha sp. (ex Lucinoma aequizonata)]MCU7899328.1 hypothetical protein [Candidatus Thiodiazotropha sp. (ex Lucinoma aequizonata)]MCU7902845.1 hypothetical protein [Candidatus Thiodiazotropha sp. (ex Lucinoma aequizonata)]